MQKRNEDTRTGGTDRMPKGNGTTVDVHVIKAEAQLAAHGEELGGKGFVGFDLIEIGHCPTSLFQSLAGGGDGAKSSQYSKNLQPGL